MGKAPLFIVCAQCGRQREVPDRRKQRDQRYCSKSCAKVAWLRTPAGKEQAARGGRMQGRLQRFRLIRLVVNLTPLQAFRLGYVRGLQSKWRKTRQRRARLTLD